MTVMASSTKVGVVDNDDTNNLDTLLYAGDTVIVEGGTVSRDHEHRG